MYPIDNVKKYSDNSEAQPNEKNKIINAIIIDKLILKSPEAIGRFFL